MRQALDKWINKGNDNLSEWKEVCGKLSDNDVDKQTVCFKFAELYENKKIPESELLASISNVTGKTFDQIDEILKGSVEEKLITGEQIAKQLGIKYDGIQEGIGMQFTDDETYGTFYGDSLEEVTAKLNSMRREFADAEKT